jgi:glycosyltransferase involved in cell wall biosynthesis
MPSPITLSGSTPVTNPAGTTITAASTDVTNIYTHGAVFTFTNAGVLIDNQIGPAGPGAAIYVVAGNNTSLMPVNRITNTGSITAYAYGIDVIAQSGQTNPVLITNSGTITATAPPSSSYGVGIFSNQNVAASVTNSGQITGASGVILKGDFNGTETVINLAGGTITATDSSSNYGVNLVQSSPGQLQGTGIVVNYGLITGNVNVEALSATIINGGTVTGLAYGEGAGELVLAPGADFAGGVAFTNQNSAGTVNGQAPSTIVLAGTGAGTLAHPGAYAGFGALDIAAGADWTLGNTTSSAGIAGVTSLTDLGTLIIAGDIAHTSITAGPSAIVAFTGVNAGNSFSGPGSGAADNATNPVTGLTNGDRIVIAPGAFDLNHFLFLGENDGTTFGQAVELVDQSFGGLYVPYSGTAADPLTYQNLSVTSFGGAMTLTVMEAYYRFTGTGDSTLASNYAGAAAPPATLSPEQILIVASHTDTIDSAAPLTNNSAITITSGALLDTTALAGTGAITLQNAGTLTLANTLGSDAGQTVSFGTGGTALALNTLDLSGTAAGFGGTIAGFGLNDAIRLTGSVLPALGLGGTVSLSYAGSPLTVAELNASGSVTASTTLDVGTGHSASGYVALLGTAGVVLETPATVAEAPLTFTGTGATASFEDPTDYAGRLAPGNIITAGETVLVTAAATLANTPALTNNGTLIVSGTASAFLDPSALTGPGTLLMENGGQATLENPSASATNFAFGGDGTLIIDNPLSTAATISNFTPTDSIIFQGLTYASTDSVTTAGTIATIHYGGLSFSLNILPSGESFHLAAGANGTVLTATPCFLAGTRIRTDQGEVPVEALRIGDRVITLAGAAMPVKFLGRRSYRQPYPENSADIIPIRICRNALGLNLPRRDLYVSPLHAMYLSDVLVPAGLLVNGRSIRACPELPAIQYIHIELAQHDVIFAEGAPSETFVDCDSRAMFENAAEFAALYPSDSSPQWRFRAPRLESGPALRRIWSRLAGRAGLTASPGAAPHAPLLGYVDHAEHTRITGWAYLPDYPDEAVELDVLDGEGLIARILADHYRADLVQAGIGNGRHGFELTFAQPLALNRPHTLRVRRAGGAELARSPISLPAQKPRTLPRPAAAKRALVLDAVWPDPTRDAGSNAILSHIAGLRALGFAVELMAVQETGAPPAGLLRAHGITTPEFASVEALLRARGGDYALVYMHRLAVAGPYGALVRALSPALRLYSVADLHHRRLAGQARIEQDQALALRAEAVRAEELLAMRQADAVITHTEAESAYLRDIYPGINVHTVSWAAPVFDPAPFTARNGVVFVGNYRHAPNQDAVRWLLGEIMPLVWAQNPGITCRIAGAGWPASALPALDARVTLTGFVPEWRDLFGQARLSVAPLRFGAGLKGKVLDSLAAGIPCAMTSLAAEGFGLQGTDSAEGLAALICRLHEDPALNTAMGREGQTLAATRFSETAMLDALRQATVATVGRNSAAPIRRAYSATHPALASAAKQSIFSST